jgi:hypothetical protein
MPTDKLYAVDRIEGALAVLIDDAGRAVDVRVDLLPPALEEGSVVRVPHGPAGDPDWSAARLVPGEAERRRAEARDRLDELRRRDPGGDIDV